MRSLSTPKPSVAAVSQYVHFSLLCQCNLTASQESSKQIIELPESAQTISALLDEMYDTYNSITGSIFTNFALRPEMEKERVMAQLLKLFVASDKVR